MSSYIDTPPYERWGGAFVYDGHLWKAHTFDRLAAQYGHTRAQAIMAGKEPATNADIAAWNALGSSRERAA